MTDLTLASQDHPASLFNRLAAGLAHPDPSCCRTEWQISFHEAFYPGRETLLRSDGESLVAFAAVVDPGLGPVLQPLECDWLFGCPLLGPHPVALLQGLLSEDRFRTAAPVLMVSGIMTRSPLLRAILTAFGRRHRILRAEPAIFRSASLEGGPDGYLARRSGNHRHKLHRAARRAAADGITFERVRPSTAAESDALYDRILAVEARSWKGLGHCGMDKPPSREFYRLLLRRWAASGAGRVVFALREGTDIGFVFGGVTGSHYRGQQFSYAEEAARWSVGNLLQLEQIRWLSEEGVGYYDMGPAMEYKVHWTEIERRTETLVLLPAG